MSFFSRFSDGEKLVFVGWFLSLVVGSFWFSVLEILVVGSIVYFGFSSSIVSVFTDFESDIDVEIQETQEQEEEDEREDGEVLGFEDNEKIVKKLAEDMNLNENS